MPAQRRTSTATASRNDSRNSGISAVDAVARAREQIEALLDQPSERVSACSGERGKGWKITVEVVELERVPPTTSLLGSYEVELDKRGELVGYRRLRRYARNQSDRPSSEDRGE